MWKKGNRGKVWKKEKETKMEKIVYHILQSNVIMVVGGKTMAKRDRLIMLEYDKEAVDFQLKTSFLDEENARNEIAISLWDEKIPIVDVHDRLTGLTKGERVSKRNLLETEKRKKGMAFEKSIMLRFQFPVLYNAYKENELENKLYMNFKIYYESDYDMFILNMYDAFILNDVLDARILERGKLLTEMEIVDDELIIKNVEFGVDMYKL